MREILIAQRKSDLWTVACNSGCWSIFVSIAPSAITWCTLCCGQSHISAVTFTEHNANECGHHPAPHCPAFTCLQNNTTHVPSLEHKHSPIAHDGHMQMMWHFHCFTAQHAPVPHAAATVLSTSTSMGAKLPATHHKQTLSSMQQTQSFISASLSTNQATSDTSG